MLNEYISKSWLELKPNEDENGNPECFDFYYSRIAQKRRFSHIPKEVFNQWIYPHHNNPLTLKNYSWIDFEKVSFQKHTLTFAQIKQINIIKIYRSYVKEKSNYKKIDLFTCVPECVDYWKNNGTWRIPPVIINANAFREEKPKWCELKEPFQLVEGYTRLGLLFSLSKIHKKEAIDLPDTHEFYLLTK
jgi:hypothetical protein